MTAPISIPVVRKRYKACFPIHRYHKSRDDLLLAEPFLQLPSKREFADYYLTIGDPVSLNEIRKKLKASEYDSLASLYEDLDLMFENCKEYNRPDSRLYKDGVKLQRIMVIIGSIFSSVISCQMAVLINKKKAICDNYKAFAAI